jgi:hypothetical protein
MQIKMELILAEYISRAAAWLFATTLVYFLLNGAQIFETAVIVPKWTASPPESFRMLQGKYGLNLKLFWTVAHSLHEITFMLAIAFCWRIDPVRNWLIILFAIHFAVRVWTLVYFAPNIIDFQAITDNAKIGADLAGRASLWRTLNYIRVGVFMAVSIGLIPQCIKILDLQYR